MSRRTATGLALAAALALAAPGSAALAAPADPAAARAAASAPGALAAPADPAAASAPAPADAWAAEAVRTPAASASAPAAASTASARTAAAAPGSGVRPHRPTARAAWTAQIAEPVVARSRPGGGRAVRSLGTRAPFWGGPEVLLVTGTATVEGERWLQVLVKGMPAGSRGWIPMRAAVLARTDRRIVVDLSDRTLVFQRAGRTVLRTSVVVGAPVSPTPTGQFAVDAVVREPPGSVLGPRVLALVAYSRTLAHYQGGIPQAAIHESDQLGDPLGTAASHGCVRAPSHVVRDLLGRAPRGTPVLIRG